MEMLLLSQDDQKIIIKSQQYKDEKELQEIIKTMPAIINLSSIFDSPMMVIGRESHYIDVLGITLDEVPVVIECKRKESPDMRYLIAQVFEYASKLESMTYHEFDHLVSDYFKSERCEEEQYRNLSLKEAFKKFHESNIDSIDSDEDFDEDNFINAVSGNLSDGEFYLVIVVNEITETASKTIQFLNRKLEKLRVEVVEISKFSDENRTIYVPNHINKEDKKQKARPGKITFEEMISECGSKDSEYIIELKNAWQDDIDFSITLGTKGFGARYQDIPILYVLPNHFRIAPRVKREYQSLFDPMMDLLRKHFHLDLKVGVTYNSEGLSVEKIRSFIKDLKALCIKVI